MPCFNFTSSSSHAKLNPENTKIVLHKSYDPSENQTFQFLTVFFSIFFTFLKNYPPKSEILFSKNKTSCDKLSSVNNNAQFFYTKSYDPRKIQCSDFLTVFWLLEKKLNLISTVQSRHQVVRSLLHKMLRLKFWIKKIVPGKIPKSQIFPSFLIEQ